ncbi:MAG TPA: DUF5320 family protein [bacterium]|nr:DUF5320 family protein [bacterium]
MPKLDKTGPLGQGPLTGRGLGPCGGGMRHGWGCFGGYGFGARRFASPKNQLVALEEEKALLEEELAAVQEEITVLKTQK